MSYDYGNNTQGEGGKRNARQAHAAARQVIGGILEVFPGYGGREVPLGEVRRLLESISGVEEDIYDRASRIGATAGGGAMTWLQERDDLSGSIDQVNRLHDSIARHRDPQDNRFRPHSLPQERERDESLSINCVCVRVYVDHDASSPYGFSYGFSACLCCVLSCVAAFDWS